MKKILTPLLALLLALFSLYFFYNLFQTKSLEIQGKTSFNIEVSENEIDRVKGLSGRKSIDVDTGMFFIFDKDSKTPFWMYDMNFSLDIIFISSDLKIVSIKEKQQPCIDGLECNLITPDQNYRYVLEVNSGMTEKYNIEVGDIVILHL